MDPAAGRARGRARGGAPGPHPGEAAPQGGDKGGNGGDDGEGAALRGRGGLRLAPFTQLITKPANVQTTVGTGGQEIDLIANYFKLLTPDTAIVHQYHVEFEPNQESIRMRRGLLHSEGARFGAAYIFDGMHDLKTLVDLDPSDLSFTATKTQDNTIVTITLKKVGTLGFGSFEMMRLYNTQMRRNLHHLGLDLIGRYYYEKTPAGRIEDYGGVTILRGFMTAINQHDAGILMVTDTIFKFIRDTSARDFMREIAQRGGGDWRALARKELVGSIVMTRYNNKTYRVDDINFDRHPTEQFETRAGPISYMDYYRNHYQIEIKDARQPLLICLPSERDRRGGRDQPVHLIPELCFMTGLTDQMRQNHVFMKSVAETSKLPPEKREQQLVDFMRRVQSNQSIKEEMGKWGIKYESQPFRLKGRLLPQEKLLMGNEPVDKGTPIEKGSFTNTMRGKPLPQAVGLERWAVLCTARDTSIAGELIQTLKRVCGPMGIPLAPPKQMLVENDRAASYIAQLQKVPTVAQLVFCLVPNNNKDRYDSIKRFCCIDKPVASQVCVVRTLQKKGGMMTIATKLAIQMTCKLGAEAWRLHIPPKRLMVIGYDTYHDSSQKGRSAGGFVCTTNDQLTNYYSRVSFHNSREEMSANFAANLTLGLKAYHAKNKALPDKMIVYRDGVSEGMIRHVYDFEVKQIERVLKELPKGSPPIQLVFIIVTKRVNARFFARRQNRTENPPCGTVIDNHVTRQERYDFYLISQTVNEGTVSPTMFDIVVDESDWPPQRHQMLAYKLTHLYYNWSGTVKVPAPCQYAHKLAFLSGQSLHREPSANLCNTLFFL